MAKDVKEEIVENLLRPALQALAAEADIQVTLYPPFCCPVESACMDADDVLGPFIGNFGHELTDDQRLSLQRVEHALNALGEDDFDCEGDIERERELFKNAHWSEIRLLARQALAAFDWKREDPSPAKEIEPNVWQGPS